MIIYIKIIYTYIYNCSDHILNGGKQKVGGNSTSVYMWKLY